MDIGPQSGEMCETSGSSAVLRSLAVAAALFLSAGPAPAHPPQSADTPAAREAAARSLVGEMMAEASLDSLQGTRERFAEFGVSKAEQTAMEQAYDAEVAVLLERMADMVAQVVARHVPLDQIRADADFESADWTAAGVELTSEAERMGLDLVMRVSETGCRSQAAPSPGCTEILRKVGEYRSGQISVDDILDR